VLVPGPVGNWDDSSVIIVSILKLEDAYVAFYEGQDRHNQYAVGLAFSSDGIRWKKYERNPILTKGAPGMFDERLVNSPHGFKTGMTFSVSTGPAIIGWKAVACGRVSRRKNIKNI